MDVPVEDQHPLGPWASRAWRAAMATLLNRQKPIARSGSAWWPGRRARRAHAGLPAEQQVDDADRAAGGVQRRASHDPALTPCPGRSCPPPRATIARSGRRARGVDRLELPRAAPRARGAPSRASRALELRARSPRSALRARGAAPVSCSSDDGCRRGPARPRGYGTRAWRATRSIAADVAVVGAGAAGLYTALTAAARARGRPRLARRRSPQTASYWAQGGLAAALADEDSPEQHLADTETAGRGAVRRSAAQVLVEEAPDVARSRAARRPLRRRPHGACSLGLEGGHSRRRVVHAGGSATGRRIVRAAVGARRRHPRIEVLEGTRAAPVARRRRPLRRRRPAGRPRGARAARSSPPAAPPRCGRGPRTRRARSARARCWRTRPAPTSPTSSSCSSTPRPSSGRARGLPRHRGDPRRGRELHGPDGERFVDELAPRDEVALAVDTVIAPGRARSGSTCGSRPARFPNVVAALRETGLDPTRELVPVAPAAHYMMGGVATDLDGRSHAARPLRGRRDRVHRPTRREPARVELAERVLRVRRRPRRRARRAPLCPPRSGPGGGADAPVAPSDTRRALWRDAGLVRYADGLRAAVDDRNRSQARRDVRVRATRAAEPIAALDCPAARPRWTVATPSSGLAANRG